jgi:hypothetical protein
MLPAVAVLGTVAPLLLIFRHWSGSFKLPEQEEYFGLRIRHTSGRWEAWHMPRQSCTHTQFFIVVPPSVPPTCLPRYIIIPVNITVGAAGSVLITLKSEK